MSFSVTRVGVLSDVLKMTLLGSSFRTRLMVCYAFLMLISNIMRAAMLKLPFMILSFLN